MEKHADKFDATSANIVQFLTFSVQGGEYGVDIMKVMEIRGWTDTTRIPNSPAYMRGVINLRGLVIPIFDLRARFGNGLTEANEKNVVIVISVGKRTIGLLADAVSDILNIKENEIQAAPETEMVDIEAKYVSGLISTQGKMVVLLDVEHLFDSETLKVADSTPKAN
jgi:purine-binding chemotaxis protein CheW